MSNIAGKAYAMNLMTPIKRYYVWLNRLIFWIGGLSLFQKQSFGGLGTLSLIHYARWVVVGRKQFPRLSSDQPKEDLKYAYMFFFSNFNGSWTQYVDSFSMAIPGGLNLLWYKSVGKPGAVPENPFNSYVIKNQIWTEHYYNSYPLASSNDVKSAQRVRAQLLALSDGLDNITADEFLRQYNAALFNLQADLSQMEPAPVVSLANEAVAKRSRLEKNIE